MGASVDDMVILVFNGQNYFAGFRILGKTIGAKERE